MFKHNFKYTLKTFFKSKSLIFWTLVFPLIMATFFFMAFSNLEENEKMSIIDIAIVENKEFNDNQTFKESFKVLSDKNNENRLFNIKYVNKTKARELLEKDKIVAYILFDNTPKIISTSSGISVTVIKYVTEEILQKEEIFKNIFESKISEYYNNSNKIGDFELMYSNIYSEVMKIIEENVVNIKNISNNNLDYTTIEYYSLIAMTCLYGGLLSMITVNQNLANMSNKGKRVGVSPTKKSILVLSSVLSGYIVQLIGIALLLLYTILILKVDYGNNLPLIILLSIIGSLSGLSIGLVVACLFKTNENTKIGIILSVSMLCCFLSGLMGVGMKYVVDKNFPLLNKFNPASMITDGFYSLYYYDTLDRYYFNIISLIIFVSIMIVLSTLSLRRQKYDSI